MKHPIDKYFRERLQNREFEFEPNDWQGAKALLDGQSKSRRRFIWLFVLIGLLIASLTTVFIFDRISDGNLPEINYAHKENISTPGKPDSELSILSNSDDMVSQKQPSEISNSEKSSTVNTSSRTDESHNESMLTDSDQIHSTVSSLTFGDSQSSSIVGINDQKVGKEAGGQSHGNTSIPVSPIDMNDYISESAVNISIAAKGQDDDPVRESSVGNPTTVSSMPVILHLPIEFLETDIEFPLQEFRPQTIKIQADQNNVTSSSLGLGYNTLILDNASTNTKFFRGHTLHAFYNKTVSPSWVLHMGLGVKYMNGDFGIAQSAEIYTSSGFEFRREILQLRPQGVYYASLPMQLRKRIKRHVFAGGMEMNKVLWVRAEKSSQTFDQNAVAGISLDAARPESRSISEVWMPTTSFNSVHWQANLGYRYHPSNWLSVGLGANYLVNNMMRANSEGSPETSGRWFVNFSVELNLWNK